MIEEVEAGQVATVIVKDMSRFGRDYLKVGFLSEVLFPSKDVRLIAINDNVDTELYENDFAPMMNLFNEWYVKNTSKKIRAVWQSKGKSGERLAVIPKYGYRKDPDDPKQWIIDEESAGIVRQIFRLNVDGHGPAEIARRMNKKHILNPSAYKFEHGIISKERPCKDPYFWNTTTIHKILDSIEYLGHTANFKTYTKSYKDKKCHFNDPEDWMIFENTHPAIIDAETWDIVRKMRQHKRRAPRYGKNGLFSGVVYCSDCGGKLYYNTRKIWNKAKTKARYEGAYSCSVYRKQTQYLGTGRACTCHYIRESVLEELVLAELRELLGFVKQYEKYFVQLVMDKNQTEQRHETEVKKKTLAKHRKRIDELDALIEKLYVDNATGKVSDERYEKISSRFESEQEQVREIVQTLTDDIERMEDEALNVDRFLDTVRRYTEIEELTPAIVHEFIDRIIVHEAEQARGNRSQKIEIIYNNVGMLNLPTSIE